MILADVGQIKDYIELIALVLSGIVIPVLIAVLGILYRHGKISKETAEGLQADLTDIAGAATKAIENQKTKNPEIAKELTKDVVANVVSKEKLDSFLGKLGLNKTEEPTKPTEPGK